MLSLDYPAVNPFLPLAAGLSKAGVGRRRGLDGQGKNTIFRILSSKNLITRRASRGPFKVFRCPLVLKTHDPYGSNAHDENP